MLLLKDNKGKVINFVFPWFWAAVVKKTVPEIGYEGLTSYSLEVQFFGRSCSVTTDF